MTSSSPGHAYGTALRARCPLPGREKRSSWRRQDRCRGGRSPFRGRGWRPDAPAPVYCAGRRALR